MMYIAYFAILHLLIDGVCALSIFGLFAGTPDLYRSFLLYNFCAFALQMPMGVFYDRMRMNKMEKSMIFIYVGIALTMLGAFFSPVLMGIGNGLFQIGGATGSFYEERVRKWRGLAAGLFTAPGAMGIFLGQSYGSSNSRQMIIRLLLILAIILLCMILLAEWGRVHLKLAQLPKAEVIQNVIDPEEKPFDGRWLLLCCLAAVILCSYIDLGVVFPWKKSLTVSLCCVGAAVLGRMAGGLLTMRFSYMRVLFGSLLAAALAYSVSNHRSTGLAAIFCFQMTMPITLQLLQEHFPKQSGLMYGFLSFGLFLGFLPIWLNLQIAYKGVILPYPLLGMAGSLLTLAIMITAVGMCRREESEIGD